MNRLTITPLRHDHLSAMAGALARAFDDDPITVHLLPHPPARPRMLRALFGSTVRDALPFGQSWGVFDGDRAVGAAAWLPPGAYPISTARNLRMFASLLPCATPRVLRAAPDGLRLFRAGDKVHPHEPHWYLAVLGIEPGCQGLGGGSQAIEPGLARCDEQHLPAYLETSKERNLAWYARFGFEPVEELHPMRDGPPLWTMLRPARG